MDTLTARTGSGPPTVQAARAQADLQAAADCADPWEQRPGEPDDMYVAFLFFRNLGPTRTVLNAWICYRKTGEQAIVAGGGKRVVATPVQAPGHWQTACARWQWLARAGAWDIEKLKGCGNRLYMTWLDLVMTAAQKCAMKLADPNCQPKDFSQAANFIRDLSTVLNPDVIAQIRPQSALDTAGDVGGAAADGEQPTGERAAVVVGGIEAVE